MTERVRARRHIAGVALALSAGAWVLHLGHAAQASASPFCWSGAVTGAWPSLAVLLQLHPPSALLIGWLLMLVAMMLPTLVAPLLHVQQRSFRQRRRRALTLFALGYFGVWLLAGGVLVPLSLLLSLAAPQSWGPALIAALLALVWQCSPIKQRCLNRSHEHRALSAFGWAADRDALRFGLSHGLWCLGSCWALMLVPMLFVQGHTSAMLAATVLMSAERLEGPRPLRWQLRGLGKLSRIVAARMRPRLAWRSAPRADAGVLEEA